MADEKKLAGFLCTGCGIGERLHVAQMETLIKRDGKIPTCQRHPMLCSEAGVELIREAITQNGVTHLLLAACSRRAKAEVFNFPEVAIARANLREGVIWSRPHAAAHQETTQEMADDYLRMACAELRFMTRPRPSEEQGRVPRVLVVGGGVTGLTAALELAAAGYSASIVECAAELGGHVAQLYQCTPARSPYAAPVDTGIAELIQRVQAEQRIHVYLNSRVTRAAGAPGRFQVEICEANGVQHSDLFGSIIQASGFIPYDAHQLPEFGYGQTPDVVTNLELEKLAKTANGQPIVRPSDGKVVTSVAFIQCAGQRSTQAGHLAYCSGFCCTTSIKQALYFKAQNPDCDTTILFSDLRTPGVSGEDFYRAAQERQVTFAKGQVRGVTAAKSNLLVNFRDLILNGESALICDLVVLATGMVANSGPDPYAQLSVDIAETEEEKIQARRALEVAPPSVLNLDYRQGTDLPQLKYGFNDSHFICFPYETRRTGIYAAGPVRRPMDMVQARDDAAGAALKAIQALENAAGGRAVHPRTGDLSFPRFRKEGCTQCKRCTVECPFGAINEDEKRYPVFNEARCRRCGTCMGACPVRVISFDNYSVETVGQQLKAVDVPDEFSEKPRILVLACENDAYPALDGAAQNGQVLTPFARVIPVRCLGSLNMSWITDALNSGYDGIVLMGCRHDDDYQCHFVRGSAMAAERLSKVGDTLSSLNLEPERVRLYEVAITDTERAPQIINAMAETVQKLGMSPFKF